ncbi:D-alanyl-D-alanine carboxypeptidase [Patescibacteria group bacterium]|nr:D-alanyl-D-alanine carboxypeptidase [Patescibacteria group bacterium]
MSKKSQKKVKLSQKTLLIKRASFFLFGLSLFFFPSNNWISRIRITPLGDSSVEVLGFNNPKVYDYPQFKGGEMPFDVSAVSVFLIDRDSGVVLFSKNEERKLLPASTVKIMTALVSLEHYNLEDVLRVRDSFSNGQDVGFKKGELVSVDDLLSALLISSANDAAMILAGHYPGGTEAFVKRMNSKAGELNLANSYFANPTGLDSDEEGKLFNDFSYSTAADLAVLARFAILDESFLKIASTSYQQISDLGNSVSHSLYNINLLLGSLPGTKGIKTGWTEEAGECFVGYVERDGRGIISVVLKSDDRFGETRRLIDWAFDNFSWQEFESASLGQ